MGACMSKKGQQQIQEKIQPSISTPTNQPTSPPIPPPPAFQIKEKIPKKPLQDREAAAANTAATATAVKKPIHVSTSKKPQEGSDEDPIDAAKPAIREEGCNAIAAAASVRTSSCTKEEVDAILIQCGRLSRSSSGKGSNENSSRAGTSRKYSGSKRSYDFDNDGAEKMCGDDEMPQIRLAHRRTPSRERDSGASELKRSGRDEGKRSGSRRASRSPGRRQETPTERTRPGKMVSVPATVSTAARKGSTKRNGEGSIRSSASPRARSPAANTRASNENPHHHNSQPSLSRNSSRKADQSPYRRNPMSEIDGNVIKTEQAALMKNHDLNNKASNSKIVKNKESGDGGEKGYHISLQKSNENAVQAQKYDERNIGAVEISNGANHSNSSGIREQLMNCRTKEQQLEPEIGEETADAKAPSKSIEATAATGVMAEVLVPKTITRSRSTRRSRDLDIGIDLNPDTLNPSTYASLLLEDIKNYHNQNTAISLPPCVSKAQSILEAVADLNSCTSSNLSSGFSEYKGSEADQSDKYNNGSVEGRFSRKRLATKDPFLESEIVLNNNDLIEPSLHKYVTVRNGRVDMEPQESAGSNSFLGHHWASSWEPNSAESTDRWGSQSNGGEEVEQALNETGHDFEVGGRRLRKSGGSNNSLLPATTTSSRKKRDFYLPQQGVVGSGKIGVRSSSLPVAAAAQ